ncbi:MAG: flavin oxidoreductase/NADH oxidase, partial [Oscillospiraceae bacterium]|nr:flavin oxidoreductase/NADH oxidase [Oscillospiraceae bacterium]
MFHYKTSEEMLNEAAGLGVHLPFSEDLSALKKPLDLGGKVLPNRIVIQPMEGCDSEPDGSPSELVRRRYDRFARSGAGLIWFEACAVVPEGRANPLQSMLTEKNLDSFKALTERIREEAVRAGNPAPLIVLQATHSGRYSKPEGVPAPMIAYNNPLFEKDSPIDKSRIVTDDYLRALTERFGHTAALAEKAGFDGVDIKACHRYLNCELLSAYEREGDYGGSFENRTRLLREGVMAAKAAVSGDFLVTTRMNIYDGFPWPYGFGVTPEGGIDPDYTEGKKLAGILHKELGVKLIDITIGNPYVNPHVNRPYDQGGYIPPEDPLVGVARMADCIGEIARAYPGLAIISSGMSYLRQFS